MEKQLVRTVKGRKRQGDKKKLLVEAALQAFLEKGFHPTRIEDIINRAQVGKGTFYLYFKSKEELVSFVLDQFIEEVRQTLSWVYESIGDSLEREEELDLAKIFHKEAELLVKTMLTNQVAGKFLLKEGRAIGPAIEEKVSTFYKEMMETSETTFALAMQMGLIRKQHPQVAAMIIIGGITQIFSHWIDGDIEEDIEILIEQTVSFFNHALGVA